MGRLVRWQTPGVDVERPDPQERVTRADRELIAGLANQGLVVTPGQLKRWRNAHLVPSPLQTSAGRGPGRQSLTYPVGTLDRAAAVARIMNWRPRVRMTEVSLWLFLTGESIEPTQVRRDFETEHQAFLARLPIPTDEKAIDAFAERLVDRFSRHPLGKVVVQTAQLGAVRRLSVAGKAAYATAYQLLGERPSKQGMRAIVRALGVEDPELQDEVMEQVRPLRLRRFVQLLETTSDAELIEARDNCLRAIALLAALLPSDVTDPIKDNAHQYRRRFKFDGHTAMIGVIQMARMRRVYPNLSSRFVEVLNEAKSTTHSGGS